MRPQDQSIKRLREAFRKNHLTVYVGAGASVASGVPLWDRLVLSLFINSLKIRERDDAEFPILRMATGKRWFEKNRGPLEVAARSLRTSFRSSKEFMEMVSFGLYQNLGFDDRGYPAKWVYPFLRRNKTLSALVKLCRRTKPDKIGLRAVVTYNLDGLLELALGSYPFQTLWKQTARKPGRLPIYHVHGYVPFRASTFHYKPTMGSTPDEIVLTEDQYHREAADPYSWSNLTQLQSMSNSVGLTAGLSLSDPNMRRLLDVTRKAPSRPEIYALLERPEVAELDEAGLEEVGKLALENLDFYDQWFKSPLPRPDLKSAKWRKNVQKTWRDLEQMCFQREVSVLRDLGVEPIWCKHAEIPKIVDKIVN
jgi:hypothetical protein